MIEEETSSCRLQPGSADCPRVIILTKLFWEGILSHIIEKRHLPLIRTYDQNGNKKWIWHHDYDGGGARRQATHNPAAEKPAEMSLQEIWTWNMYSIPLLSATATVWRMPHPLPLRNLRHRRIIPLFLYGNSGGVPPDECRGALAR